MNDIDINIYIHIIIEEWHSNFCNVYFFIDVYITCCTLASKRHTMTMMVQGK